jgi:hypothetical protein
MALRGAANDLSKEAVDAALNALDHDLAYPEIAAEIWARVASAAIDANVGFGGKLIEAERERLIAEICTRLARALRGPVEG